MNKMKKFALIAVCAMLLVCVTIGATVAYLTSNDEVVNTFTVGQVKITLDEAQVDGNGDAVTPETRVKENTYHLMPGHEYDKDPTVHVEAGSEDCWVFVKVTNQIAAIVSEDTNIETQITRDNNWMKLEGEEGVYYKEYTKGASADYLVFDGFKVSDNVDNDTLARYAPEANSAGSNVYKKITVKAYAIQKDGFETAAAAWAVVSD